MPPLSDETQKNRISSQSQYVPIILWLFPLLLLNIGWYFFYQIDRRWEEQERTELAKQEAEGLAAGSEFSYRFALMGDNFRKKLESSVESLYGSEHKGNHKENFLKYIKSNAEHIFRAPFPQYELFVFQVSSEKNKSEVIYSNMDNVIGKRALAITFEFFAKVNSSDSSYSEESRKASSAVAKSVLGGECDPEIIGVTQKGKASFTFYKLKANRFVWDYFKNEKTGDIFGYFIFVDNDSNTDLAGRLLAIRAVEETHNLNEGKKKYAAFIPLFPNYGGVIASEEITKIPDFTAKVRKWVPKDEEELYEWLKHGGVHKLEDLIVGNYQAFIHLAAKHSHAAVFFCPLLEEINMPKWLFVFNIAVISLVLLLLSRGILLGVWPNTSLRTRFITTYFLAACLPLGLLIIASYGYISEYRHTSFFESQSRLRLCINQFDSRKAQVQDEYRSAFLEIQNDQEFIENISRLEKIASAPLNFFAPEAKAVLNRALDILNSGKRNLPIISFAIVDEWGGYFCNIGTNTFQYYVNHEGKEFLEGNKTAKDAELKKYNDTSMNTLVFPIVESLRKRIEGIAPETKKWTEEFKANLLQESTVGAVKAIAGDEYDDIAQTFNKRRNIIMSRIVGESNVTSNIHNYVFVDGIPRYAMYMVWDETVLDDETFQGSLDYFSLKEPDYIFSGFRASPSGVKPWKDSGRHGRDFEALSLVLANNSYFRRSAAINQDKGMLLQAIPSKKYSNIIIVGGVSNHHIEMPVFIRFCACIIIIILALLIFVACVYYSSKIFLKPIRRLKESLDKVAEGNFEIEIQSQSKDEFGILCHEFSEMTKGLNERNKLATLLSDQAVEALSKNKSGEELSDVETFKGTVLVSDIRNFTGMCESYPPDQIIDLLNEHFAQMTKIVSANGGRIYKYIGDAVEVVFADSDDSGGNSIERAFVAAYEMLNCLEEINKERKKNHSFSYKIGVGLCYGKMSSGTIGSLDTRLDYAVLGDTLKNAAKLESLSKYNPDFPLVVGKSFVTRFNLLYPEIKFVSVKESDELEAFNISKSGLKRFLEMKSIGESLSYEDISSREKSSKNNETPKNNYFDLGDFLTSREKFISGFLFISFLSIILICGIYFVHFTADNSEKVALNLENQRTLEQMLCAQYGKVAFDMKCRQIALEFQKKLDELDESDITDDILTKSLEDSFKKHKALESIKMNHLFVRMGDCSDMSFTSPSFIDKLPLFPLANRGYVGKEVDLITNSFRICRVLNMLEAKKNELEEGYDELCRNYMRENYGEPSREVFGEKITINMLERDAINATVDAVYRKEDCYMFWLDYFKGDRLIGYLIFSAPSQNVDESIPFFLEAYSRNKALVSLKNRGTKEWKFSENVPEYIRKNTIESENKRIVDDENSMEEVGNEYLQNLYGVTSKGIITIGNNEYDLYLTALCENNKNNLRNSLVLASILLLSLYFFLWQILKGKSKINSSVAAKLWLALLIVAVIPVLTVFFVFGLFRSEYYTVKSYAEKAEMQRFNELYESKEDFANPIAWSFIRSKNNSKEFSKIVKLLNDNKNSKEQRMAALKELRRLVNSWVDENKAYSEKKNKIINFNVGDISISGIGNWGLCFTDAEDSLVEKTPSFSFVDEKRESEAVLSDVSYMTTEIKQSRQSFGVMLKQMSRTLLNRRGIGGSSFNRESMTNEVAVEIGLDAVKTFFDADTFIKIAHGIDLPAILSAGIVNIGFLVSPIPSYEKPEAIVVWMIVFHGYRYLEKLAKNVNLGLSDYQIYPAEKYRYGRITNSKNNKLRIPLGGFAAWISTCNSPLSTTLDIDGRRYLIESGTMLRQLNTLAVLSCPESKISNEINKMTLFFYSLLSFSLVIIIIITRNIANDIITPINYLISGIKEVDAENFAYRINSDRTDELGALCLSFDKMAKGLDEKRMMSSMLSRTAKMVTLKTDADSSRKADCVFLYAGIPDFSSWMIGLRDYEVFSYLKSHTSIIAGIVMEEGGEVDKIMGEKLLAVFRVEDSLANSVISACKAASRMMELEKSSNLPFPIAIGLNYGNVINGFLGVGNKRDFTVIGDAVNVTARIQSLAERLRYNRCLISEDVCRLISQKYTYKTWGEVELKGKAKPMKVHRLLD